MKPLPPGKHAIDEEARTLLHENRGICGELGLYTDAWFAFRPPVKRLSDVPTAEQKGFVQEFLQSLRAVDANP
jgi:hypothetical protein